MRNPGRIIVWFVAAIGLLAFVAGWWVTREVRATSRRTDQDLVRVAEAIERFASAHGGSMPQAAEALQPGQDPALAESLGRIQVAWPPSPDLAPILGSNGLPSGVGTLPRVNDRLRSLARGSAVAGGPS
ncbi:MAG: hypothetical protein EBQ99_03855 [Planctomycetes bacterium]|nr:hypothetical protein [Planctomycetota bacterium]